MMKGNYVNLMKLYFFTGANLTHKNAKNLNSYHIITENKTDEIFIHYFNILKCTYQGKQISFLMFQDRSQVFI